MAKPVIWTVDDDPDVLRRRARSAPALWRPLQGHLRGFRDVQWSPQSSEIRDFLGRNFVPHQWLNVETDETAKQLLTTTGDDVSSLPIVLFTDGSFLGNPSTGEVAQKLGLKTKAEFPFYDLVVVGAGPAGLAAAVYGAADGLHTLLIEREAPGGQAGRSSRIENYLGFPVGLSG